MAIIVHKKGGLSIALVAFLIAMGAFFVARYSTFKEPSRYTDSSSIVHTNDPLVTQRLSERDLLPTDIPLVTFLDPARGNPEAQVTIIEFSDFECPFCKSSVPVIEDILLKYPDRVRHVWKDAPATSLHQNALSAHLAARCAQDQQKFWEFHDALFNNQTALNQNTYAEIARKLGLNTRAWQQCFDEQQELPKIERSLLEAEVLGIHGTPFFFINETRVSGEISFEQIDQIVKNKLQ